MGPFAMVKRISRGLMDCLRERCRFNALETTTVFSTPQVGFNSFSLGLTLLKEDSDAQSIEKTA
jgi:hypothetical protein